MIPVVFLSYNDGTPPRGYWDMGIIEDFIAEELWKPTAYYTFYSIEARSIPADLEGAVIVFPARAQVDYVDKLNEEIANLKWCVILLTGDEEGALDPDRIQHPNAFIYVMSPKMGLDEKYRKLGTGYPPQLKNFVQEGNQKTQDWFFAGQDTHKYRNECVEELQKMWDGTLLATVGFTQGMEHSKYYDELASAKVAPSPSGPVTPDTFRLFEALELACVPIPDERDTKGYWTFFFGEEPPFPMLDNYQQLTGYIEDSVKQYPALNNKVFSWWIGKKRQLTYDIQADIATVSNIEPEQNTLRGITVIIPSSPIKSNPDIRILDETIQSVRHHLPDSEIILTFDGVRLEQEDRRADYNEFIRRILWKCNTQYKNVVPLIFEDHTHQVGMARKALEYVTTPFILYMEQDTPLVLDYDFPWGHFTEDIASGISNLIRFHFEAVIPEPHEHMMHGLEPNSLSPLLRTSQYSQRPHLASKAYYQRMLSDYFTEDAKSFIEDKMHGILDQAYNENGLAGWHQHKVHIYYPKGNIKRSYHTDGREGESKWDGQQKF